MGLVRRAIDLARLFLEVTIEDLVNGEDTHQAVVVVAKRDHRAFLQVASLIADGQGDGQRPWGAVGELGSFDNALVVTASLEPGKRRIRPTAEQCGIRGGSCGD